MKYLRRLKGFIVLITTLFYSLVSASLRIARDVLSMHPRMRPGIIAVPLHARTDIEITLLSQIISLTPGSLTIDISSNRKWLFVHLMYIDDGDVEKARTEIKKVWEQRVLEILR